MNPFDQFDDQTVAKNPFDQFDQPPNSAAAELKDRAKAAVGGIEAAGSMLSGMPAQIAGGLVGLSNLVGTGGDIDKAVAAQKYVQDKNFGFGQYHPQTDYGKLAEEGISSGINNINEKAKDLGEKYGGETGRLTADIGTGALENLAPIPGGKLVGKLGEGFRREFGGVESPAPRVEPTTAKARPEINPFDQFDDVGPPRPPLQVTPEGQAFDPRAVPDVARDSAVQRQRQMQNEQPMDMENPYPVDVEQFPQALKDAPYQAEGGLDFTEHTADRLARPLEDDIANPQMKPEESAWEGEGGSILPSQRGAIDMEAVRKGLQELRAGTRVETPDGSAKVLSQSTVLIKNPDTIREHLNDIADHATSVADELRLQNEFLKNHYENIPHDHPMGAYTVQYPDGTVKRVFGEDIRHVYQGLSAVPSAQRGAINFKDIQSGIQSGLDKIDNVAKRMGGYKPSPYTDAEKVVLDKLGKTDYIARGDAPEKVIADSLAAGKDLPTNIWENLQSGVIHAGEKTKSPLLMGIGRHMSAMEHIGERYIRNQVRPVEALLSKLKFGKTADFIKAMEAVRADKMSEVERSPQELKDAGLSDRAIQAVTAIKQAHADVLNIINKTNADLGKPPVTAKDAFMASMFSGQWHLPLLDGKGNVAWYLRAGTKAELNKAIKWMKNNPEVAGVLNLDKAVPKFYGENIGTRRPADVVGAYQHMLEVFKDDPVISKIMQKAMEDYVAQKGYNFQSFQKHLEPGQANVRGYLGDQPWLDKKTNAVNFAQAQIKYLQDAYRWVATNESLGPIKQILSSPELNAQQPRNMELARQYVSQAMGVSQNIFKGVETKLQELISSMPVNMRVLPTNLNKFIGSLKTMTYLVQLGASPGYMIATPLQAFLLGPARHLKLTNEGFDHNTLQTMAISVYDFGLGLVGHGVKNLGAKFDMPMSEIGKAAFKYMEDAGIISQNVFHEASGLGENAAVHAGKQLLGWTISMPEKIARAATFMSFVHHLDASSKFETRAELFRRAEELTNHTLTDFRRMSRPLAVDKLGALGEVGYTYKSPMFNQYNSLSEFARDARKGNVGPLLSALGMTALLGGVTALPFVNEMDQAWNIIKNTIAKAAPQHYPAATSAVGQGLGVRGWAMSKINEMGANDSVQHALGQTGANFARDTANYGLPSAATGSQLASRFSSNIGDLTHPLGNFAPATQEASEWLSALGGITHLNSTTASQGIHDAIAPALMKGQMETRIDNFKAGKPRPQGQGYVNPTDIEGGQLSYVRSPAEETKRQFGLTSLDEATTKNSRYINNQESMRFKTAQDTSMTRVFDAIRRKDPDAVKEYAVSYFKNNGDPDQFTSELNKKIEGLVLTPEERNLVNMGNKIANVQKYMRLRQLQGR